MLLSVLAVSLAVTGVSVAQTNQAEGSDADIYIDYGGLAFQDGKNINSFIALYTPTGALNSSDNEFYIKGGGGGMFRFYSNETFELQFLKSVAANIRGDQGKSERGIQTNADGLSISYPVDAGDTVTITWAPTINYPFALPLISFWGMVGGALLGCVFTGAGIKKRKFTILFTGIVAFLVAFIFYLIFINL